MDVYSGHVWMWELDHKEGQALNWCFWTVVPERTLESPLACKEIQPVNPKGNQPWIFIQRTNAEAPIIWPPDVKNWLIGKDPDAGRDGRQKEQGRQSMMVRRHHWLDGHESEWTRGVGDATQTSHPLPSPSLSTFNLSQHQGLFLKINLFTLIGG